MLVVAARRARSIEVLLLAAAAAVLTACSSSGSAGADDLVTCGSGGFPTSGQRCDPAAFGPHEFCQTGAAACGWGSVTTCGCLASARWDCSAADLDGWGCGTPPHCTDDCPCPASAPSAGESCANAMTICEYGPVGCQVEAYCSNNGNKWQVTCSVSGADAGCTCPSAPSDAGRGDADAPDAPNAPDDGG